jgi:uncharacterized protein YggE
MRHSNYWHLRIAVTAAVLALGVLILTLVGPELAGVEAQAPAAAQPGRTAAAGPQLQGEAAMTRTITVVGEGQAQIEPDIAQTNIGVEVVTGTVRAASDQAADTMNAVMAAIRAQGVADEDMQTSGYNVWVERPYGPEGPRPDAAPLYHVNNSVNVTIRDLDTVGAILDAAMEAGANNIFGVTFSIEDPGAAQSQAREEAVSDARAKAEELAGLHGLEAGEVISISEVIAQGGFFPSTVRMAAADMGAGGGAGPISPGQLQVSVQLQVTYALR